MADEYKFDGTQSVITPGVRYLWGGGVKGDCIRVALVTRDRGAWREKDGTYKALGGDVFGASRNRLDGLIAQTVTGQIQKQPRQFYEIGTTKYYFVESRPSGSGSIDHIIGPNKQNVWKFLAEFADVCKETDLVVGKKKGCTCDKDNSFEGFVIFKSGLLNSFQVTATANDWVLTSRLGFTFYDLVGQESFGDID